MSERVLIAYYSKTGTTRKVCLILNEYLSEAGFETVIKEFAQVREVASYDKIVIAAPPINGMQWVESARNFIEKYEMELAGKGVVAIFVSYIIKTGSRFWKKKIQRGVKLMLRSIKPEVYADFGGVVDKPFPNFARWMFGIKKRC